LRFYARELGCNSDSGFSGHSRDSSAFRKEVEFDPVTEIAGRSCETTMGDDHMSLGMRR
jgi:hypothetical protein